MNKTPAYNAGLHRFAVIVTGAVLFMIVAGGMVTSMEAGDAVPDWPLSYHSLLPPMVANVFYEHGHRMIGWLLGILTITLALWLKLKELRRAVRRLGYVALAAVCLQGLLGGLRVLIVSNEALQDALFTSPTGDRIQNARLVIAIIHTTSGQGILCLMAVIALVTSRRWMSPEEPCVAAPDARRLRLICLSTTAVVFMQLLLGAVRRHTDGTIVLHLIGAAVVVLHVALVLRRLLPAYHHVPALVRPAVAMVVLVVLQLMLGTASWVLAESETASVLGRPRFLGSDVAGSAVFTAHVALGAVLLATSVVLSVGSSRFAGRSVQTETSVPCAASSPTTSHEHSGPLAGHGRFARKRARTRKLPAAGADRW